VAGVGSLGQMHPVRCPLARAGRGDQEGKVITMKDMTVYVVHHDHGGWSVRTTSVGKKWTEGPEKDCTVYEATLNAKAARSIAQEYLARLAEEEGEAGPGEEAR